MALSTISVGVDGSDGSVGAVEWATAVAAHCGATVRAVMSWHYPYLATLPGLMVTVPPAELMEAQTELGYRRCWGGPGSRQTSSRL